MDYLEPKITTCAVCGEAFDASLINRGKGIHRYCGKVCRTKADNARAYARRKSKEPLPDLDKTCVICFVRFTADKAHPNALTCSKRCSQARMDRLRRQDRAKNTDLSPRACEECGELYQPNVMVAHRQKYCSDKCLGRVTQRKHRRGPEHNKRLRTADWKRAALAAKMRADSKCQACGSVKRLAVHHKFHLTEAERHDHSEANLIVLCNSCHHGMHDVRIGRQGDKFVISGLVFKLLGISEVEIVNEEIHRPEEAQEGL